MWCNPTRPLLQDQFWTGFVVPVRVPSMDQIHVLEFLYVIGRLNTIGIKWKTVINKILSRIIEIYYKITYNAFDWKNNLSMPKTSSWNQKENQERRKSNIPRRRGFFSGRRNLLMHSSNELISDVLLWTPSHGWAKARGPARTYKQ